MQNVKEVEHVVHIGLTAEQAAELLKSSKPPLCLCIGNIGHRSGVYHSGTVVAANQIDPVMLSEPISLAHPHIKKVYPLAEGLEMLTAQRLRWDDARQPKKDQVLKLSDEIARMLPTWTAPYL